MYNNNPNQNQGYNGVYSYTAGNSSQQVPINQFGLRDKYDQSGGLMQVNPLEPQFTTLEQTIIVDTRDCVGVQSLEDARSVFGIRGGRASAHGNVVSATGLGVNPISITVDSATNLANGDLVTFVGVQGNTIINGTFPITNLVGSTFDIAATGNGNYTGGGQWSRPRDSGYPEFDKSKSKIVDNQITVELDNELKFLRSLTLFHIVIPRDIIPLNFYIKDFIPSSTTLPSNSWTSTDSVYTTYIPMETKFMENRMLGFYSTTLDMWRNYTGAFSVPDQVTPPPMQLWNPPLGAWPNQPQPYPYQTVPSYRSNTFTVTGTAGNFYLVNSGYGVYDLVDWTSTGSGVVATDILNTTIMRKLLLLAITPRQSLSDVDYIDLILNANVVTPGNVDPTQVFGFGDFQRYLPGPGLGQTYQPGTNAVYNAAAASGPPNVVQPDSPIPFPEFRGNVWGPYNRPGDRFQKVGLKTLLQDLYMNGDTYNLTGAPIVKPDVPIEDFQDDTTYGLNFSSLIDVYFDNVLNTTNLNILNAMRIIPNGFGALSLRAQGGAAVFTQQYQSAGGQGPSNLGTPSAWVNTNVYGGAGVFDDPIAQGPSGPNITAATTDASNPGTTAPAHEASYYDLGPNSGQFLSSVQNYIGFVVNDIPDTDLIVKLEEAEREERSRTTRSFNDEAILDCPIRLNLGTTSGTLQYVEALQSLITSATAYWNKRFLNPKARMDKLHISLYTYDGQAIPLENMLQTRRSLEYLRIFIRFQEVYPTMTFSRIGSFKWLFDPTDPELIGRTKRYIQIIFKAVAYNGTPPGLEPTKYTHLPPGASIGSDIRPYT